MITTVGRFSDGAIGRGVCEISVNWPARQRFDRLLEEVLEELPPAVCELLDKVPLHVEDYPSAHVMKDTGTINRDDLCGLYTGIPLTNRSIEQSGRLPDVVTIFREGILAAATNRRGRIPTRRLKNEIRKTILHELAHYHGLDEEELWELGYG